jgi:hypothetical protein
MASLLQKIMIPTIVMVWGTFYLFEVMQLHIRNQYLIRPAYFILLALYIFNTYHDVRKWKKEQEKSAGQVRESFKVPAEMKTLVIIALITVGYLVIMPLVGFTFSTIAYLVVLLLALNVRKMLTLIFFPTTLTIFVYVVFRIFLRLPLPGGFIGF